MAKKTAAKAPARTRSARPKLSKAAADKRRMTIYLPEKLAMELEIHCVKTRQTLSHAIEAWIRKGLRE